MKRLLISVIIVGTFLLAPMMAQADVVTFTGGARTTDWNTAGNWSPARVPLTTDDVTIPAGQTVTNKPFAALGSGAINSLTLDGTLTIDSSGLNLQSAAPSTINNLTLTSTQGSYSQLTMQGPTTFGTLVLSPGVVIGNGAATINGPVTISNGSSLGPASVDNKGPITIAPSNSHVTLGTTGFTNDTTGSITLLGDGIIVSGSGTFTNSGSIAMSMGTGTSIFNAGSVFSNSKKGTVAAQSGTLQLAAVGMNTGVFSASAGATLQFANVMTLNAGTTFGGSGTLDIKSGGVWDVEAEVMVDTTNLTFDGGQATMISGKSNLTINSTTVTWNSGVLGPLASIKVITLSKGVTMAIVTAGYHGLVSLNLDVQGTVNMSADLQLSSPTITIEPKAKFNIQTDNGIHGGGGALTTAGPSRKPGVQVPATLTTPAFLTSCQKIPIPSW